MCVKGGQGKICGRYGIILTLFQRSGKYKVLIADKEKARGALHAASGLMVLC